MEYLMRAAGSGDYGPSAFRAKHGSRPVCLPLPSFPQQSLSAPANSVFPLLLEAKTERFAVHLAGVTHKIVCPVRPM